MATVASPVVPSKGSPILEIADLMLDAGCSERAAKQLISTALMTRVLELNKGNISRAARQLEIHRNMLAYRLRQLGLTALPRLIRQRERVQLTLAFPRKKPSRSSSGDAVHSRLRRAV